MTTDSETKAVENFVLGDSLIPELHKEFQNKELDGEITEYFVNTFIGIAEEAVPIIDKIESR